MHLLISASSEHEIECFCIEISVVCYIEVSTFFVRFSEKAIFYTMFTLIFINNVFDFYSLFLIKAYARVRI